MTSIVLVSGYDKEMIRFLLTLILAVILPMNEIT